MRQNKAHALCNRQLHIPVVVRHVQFILLMLIFGMYRQITS